jgi:hypothetical protein
MYHAASKLQSLCSVTVRTICTYTTLIPHTLSCCTATCTLTAGAQQQLQWAIASGSGWRFWQCEHFAPKRYASAHMQHQAAAALDWAHANGCPCSCGWFARSNSSSSTSNCSSSSSSVNSTQQQQQHVQLPLLQLVAAPQQQQQQQQWLRLAPVGHSA